MLAHVLKDEQIPEAVKVEFHDFEFMMIQYGVPMLRNPSIDMIFLFDCPPKCSVKDV